MSMLRPVIVLALSWFASGCSNDGSYQVGWTFFDAQPFHPGDCGKVGVSAIAISSGVSADAGQEHPVFVACAPGTYTGRLAPGTWTLVLAAIDAEGHPKEPATSGLLRGTADGVTVTEGHLTPVPGLVLLPRLPECRDGVDNDHDGRVDLDDPDCAGDPLGSHECTFTASGQCGDTSP
jgi:hypothetical protein